MKRGARGLSRVTTGIACASVLLAGCSDSPLDGPGEQTRLTVHLTDAPGDVEAVWVDIEALQFQGGPAGATSVLNEPVRGVELTELVGRSRTLTEEMTLPAGRYLDLRFVLSGAVLETTDGNVYSYGTGVHPEGTPPSGALRCPSCASSGLKVKLAGNEIRLEPGDRSLTLDFDVGQSFGRAAGRSGAWVMHPVIHGTVADESGAHVSGTVALQEGVAIPACPANQPRSLRDFVPTATSRTTVDGDGAPLHRTGSTVDAGAFRIGPLESDTWALGYVSEIGFGSDRLVFEATVDPDVVDVGDQGASGVSYRITSATCEPIPTSGAQGNPTTASFWIESGPSPSHSVWLDVTEIYYQGGPNGRADFLDAPTGWVPATTVEDAVHALSDAQRIRSGRYTRMRVRVDGAVLRTASGEVLVYGDGTPPDGVVPTGILQCPTCGSAGITVALPGRGSEMLAGEHTAVVLELDVDRSLSASGSQWRLAPVLNARHARLGDGDERSAAPRPAS